MLSLDIEKPYERVVPIYGKHVIVNNHYMYHILKRLQNGYSTLIFICGQQRVGKSFIGVYHQWFFNNVFGQDIDDNNIADVTFYDPETIADKLKRRRAYIVDEAGVIYGRKEWYTKTARAMSTIVQSQQNLNFVLLFISPFFVDVNSSIAKNFDYTMRVDQRGAFKVFKMHKKYDATKPQDAFYPRFMDNCYLHKTDLPADIWNIYEKYSFAQKENIRLEQVKMIRKEKRKKNKDALVDNSDLVDDYGGAF